MRAIPSPLVSIVTRLTALKMSTRAKEHTTLRTRLLSSFKMQSQSNDFSYFLTSGERDLESLTEDYFSVTPLDEQDDQEDNYGSDFSGDETDQEIDSDVDFDFSECDTSERLRVQAFVTK